MEQYCPKKNKCKQLTNQGTCPLKHTEEEIKQAQEHKQKIQQKKADKLQRKQINSFEQQQKVIEQIEHRRESGFQYVQKKYNQLQGKQVRIGIDFGNVITGQDPTLTEQQKVDMQSDTMFGENYLQTQSIPDAFSVIKGLISKYGAENVFIVSKARQKMQQKSKHWMEHHKIQGQTGFLYDKNLYFCEERSQKAEICRNLHINFFIDDKQDVLQNLDDVVIKFLFPTQPFQRNWSSNWVSVNSWKHIEEIFGTLI